MKWRHGRPKKPGLYWIYIHNLIYPSAEVHYVGNAIKADSGPFANGGVSVYVIGQGGSAPIECLTRDGDFWHMPISGSPPKHRWSTEPQLRHWQLWKDESSSDEKNIAYIIEAHNGNVHGHYVSCRRILFGSKREVLFHSLKVPAPPRIKNGKRAIIARGATSTT